MYLVSWEYDMSSHIAVYEGHFDLIFRLHDIIQAASLLDRSSCKVLKESPEKTIFTKKNSLYASNYFYLCLLNLQIHGTQ